MLAIEKEETCLPSFGLIEIFGAMYSAAVGLVGSRGGSAISIFLTAGVSSTIFFGLYSAFGSATVSGEVLSAAGAVFVLD
jgi:hypothetical protein